MAWSSLVGSTVNLTNEQRWSIARFCGWELRPCRGEEDGCLWLWCSELTRCGLSVLVDPDGKIVFWTQETNVEPGIHILPKYESTPSLVGPMLLAMHTAGHRPILSAPETGGNQWLCQAGQNLGTGDNINEACCQTILQIVYRDSLPTAETLPDSEIDWFAERILHIDFEREREEIRELIAQAEDTNFTPEQNRQLAPRLLQIAEQLRDSDDPDDRSTVWSAVRTGGSMLRPHEAELLLPLLQTDHRIDTCLVTVKMLGRIFEAQPPSDLDQFPSLYAPVLEIAESLLNRHALVNAEVAATAQLAVHALVAMGCSDSYRIVKKAVGLRVVPWFIGQLARDMRGLELEWAQSPTRVGHKPRQLLESIIRELLPPQFFAEKLIPTNLYKLDQQ